MPETTAVPLPLPTRAWQRSEVRQALQSRDVGALLRAAQQHTGASQNKLAVALGMTQGRVSEIMRGTRTVTALDSFERIADGLAMPDDARMLLGLAPVHPAGLDHLSASGRAEILAVYPSQSAARPEIEQLAGEAELVEVLAVRGLGIIGLNDSLLRRRVQARQVHVRVLLLDPDGEAARRRAVEIGETTGVFQAGVRLSIELLADLAASGATVEGYLYDLLPTWRLITLDSTLFLSAFGEQNEGHTSPMYKLTGSPHGALHRGFRRFSDELRRTARRVI
ncbi:helix-turn-helix transcriptional regulator [Amycolatopsis sp. GM8]|uniref:helix-turn-helix domain-containing protein n=1 Tax=Amycolatopsis sp. GM8 TaxID=2896530 RepID=UPI001F2B26D9|nr:helix-turn-helix transcriptional regulator [Amycolatopsis sp. GM8]